MHNLVQKYFFPSPDIALTTGTIGLGNKQRNLKEILVEHQLGVDVPPCGREGVPASDNDWPMFSPLVTGLMAAIRTPSPPGKVELCQI